MIGTQKLSSKQIEVLEAVVRAGNLSDAALLLRLSDEGLSWHLRHIRKAMGVETTLEAVLKAIRLGVVVAAPEPPVGSRHLA